MSYVRFEVYMNILCFKEVGSLWLIVFCVDMELRKILLWNKFVFYFMVDMKIVNIGD